MTKTAALSGFLVLALLLGSLAFFRGSRAPTSDSVPEGAPPAAAPQRAEEMQEAVSRSAASGALERQAVEPDPLRLRGLVLGTSDHPLPRARVQVLCLSQADLHQRAEWHTGEWGPLEREARTAETDEQGRFVLEGPLEAPDGLVLWATHPDHLAGCALLGPDPDSWPGEVRIVLEPHAAIEVAVVDATGRPLPGAEVEQFGSTPEASRAGPLDEAQARRLSHRIEVTGPDGTVRFGPLPGRQVFVASRGGERSVPWQGTAQERVVLTLRPTFEVAGTVSMPRREGLEEAAPCLTIAAQDRNLWRTLATLRDVEDGPWGPIAIPEMAADRYRVRLEGAPLVPVEEFFDPPRAGSRRIVNLAASTGVSVRFRVTDEGGEGVPEAVVRVKWQEANRPDHWNFAERGCDETGQTLVSSLPEGAMLFEAHAPGFVPFFSSLEATAAYESTYVRIRLEEAGRLTGRCTQAGEPVPDFEILVWTEVGTTPQSIPFLDRDDGSFEIDTVPTGPFWVSASTGDHPGGEPVSVTCPAGGTAEVWIDLPECVAGRGRVVDEVTGEPLAEAAIQLFVPASPIPIARWGLPVPVQPDGTFEFARFLEGTNHLRALAPGYSNRIAVQTTTPEGDLDFGTIALAPSQPLRIVLEREDPTRDVQVSGRGSLILENRRFENDNTVVYENVSAGGYALSFKEGNWSSTLVEVDLATGSPWLVRERIDGPNRLAVECTTPDGQPYGRRFQLSATYLSPQGFRHERSTVSNAGIARLQGIDASTVSVLVRDWDGNELGVSGGRFTGGELHLVVPIDQEPFDLRVVDGEGQPLAGVRVMVLDPRIPGMTLFGNTAESGECRIVGVPAHEVQVHLQHSTGSRLGVPVDASTRTAELVLDPTAKVEVRFLDGDLPLEGVTCVVIDDTKVGLTPEARSDAGGRATIPALAPGSYPILATRSDCWRVESRAEARAAGAPTPVQMRRLADLALQVLSAEGLPIAGIAVDLRSLEFDTAVEDWIGDGRARSAGLVTDADGLVRVEGVPHGEYGWSLDLPDGPHREGRLTVGPGSNPPLRVVRGE